jgi:zinc protease
VTTPTAQAEAFRRRAPEPLAPRTLNLPEPREKTLANGLQVVVVEDRRLPLLSLRLSFRVGSANDPGEIPGLMSIMAGLLTEGTTSRTSREIAEEVALIGGTLTAGANSDFTTVAASALSTYGNEIFDLLADVTRNPAFDAHELSLAKENTKQGLIQQRAQPSFLASEQVARVLFGSHPYAVITPSEESVDATTRDLLFDHHNRLLTPNQAVLIAVGDVDFDEFVTRADRLFGDWAPGGKPQTEFPALPKRTRRTAHIVDRAGSEQSNIVIANEGIKRDDPDFFPMLLMHTVLGANASSRLFMNLREDKGYTYGAYSTLDARGHGGSFRASAEVRTPVTGAALTEFFLELDRIRSETVSTQEIVDAKSYLTGVFPIRLETQEGLTDQLVQMKMFGLPDDYLHTYRERVSAVSIEDVLRVAQRNVLPDQAAVVIVGDAAAIEGDVRKFTDDVEILDASGHQKT